MIFNTESFEGI